MSIDNRAAGFNRASHDRSDFQHLRVQADSALGQAAYVQQIIEQTHEVQTMGFSAHSCDLMTYEPHSTRHRIAGTVSASSDDIEPFPCKGLRGPGRAVRPCGDIASAMHWGPMTLGAKMT